MAVIDISMDYPSNCHECENSRCVKSRIPWVTATKDYRTDRHSCCPLHSADELKQELFNHLFDNSDIDIGLAEISDIEAIIDKYCGKEQNNE